jgi:hypothetical protein
LGWLSELASHAIHGRHWNRCNKWNIQEKQ